MRDLDFGTVDPIADFDDDSRYIGFSGGKDSTALACAYTKNGIPFQAVYADTGWEKLDEHGQNVVLGYVKDVAARLRFPLHVVERPGGMQHMMKSKAKGGEGRGMPRVGLTKYCSRELKVRPKFDLLRARHGEDLSHVLDAIGIRAQESRHRADQPINEVANFGLNVVRPIHQWTVEDVLTAHHEMGIEINPIYRMGLDRVGCWPCVHASKNEITTIARIDPERIQLIREIEEDVASYRARDWVENPETEREIQAHAYGAKGPTFFSISKTFAPIDEVIQWARTTRGGKQFNILADDETEGGGCMRWGLCDAPVVEDA